MVDTEWVPCSNECQRRVVALAVLVSVLWTGFALKAWALSALVEPLRFTGWFTLHVHHNPGIFLGQTPFLPSVAYTYWLLMVLMLAWLMHQFLRADPLPLKASLALVLGGMLGNITERLVSGAVVDYMLFHNASGYGIAVNFADFAIVSGCVLITFTLRHGFQD